MFPSANNPVAIVFSVQSNDGSWQAVALDHDVFAIQEALEDPEGAKDNWSSHLQNTAVCYPRDDCLGGFISQK